MRCINALNRWGGIFVMGTGIVVLLTSLAISWLGNLTENELSLIGLAGAMLGLVGFVLRFSYDLGRE